MPFWHLSLLLQLFAESGSEVTLKDSESVQDKQKESYFDGRNIAGEEPQVCLSANVRVDKKTSNNLSTVHK